MTNHVLITKATAALAESISTIVDVDGEQAAALAQTFEQAEQYLKDSVADETESAPRLSQRFSSPRAAERAAACILAARRVSKSATTAEELRAQRTANLKSLPPISIAKALVEDQHAYSITEAELVDLIGNHDRQPGETAAKCFARHYEAPTEDGAAIRKAIEITKAAEVASLDPVVIDGNDENPDDAEEAYNALMRLADEQRARAPNMSKAQAFAEVFQKNPELASRAHRRPSASTVYPMPR